MKLHFSRGNAKLDALEKRMGKKVYSFSTLSGVNCPYAKECRSQATVDAEGKKHIEDGPHTLFRCFSASQEVIFSTVYNTRKANVELIALAARSESEATELVLSQLPDGIIRLNIGGDFPTKRYFKVWINVAKARPKQLFYAYTKSLPFWVAYLNEIPDNLILTASYGGYRDDLIEKNNLRYVKVVYSVAEARKLKLPIDHDDSHACLPKLRNKNFSLLIHNIQPKGSAAGEAVRKLAGNGSYKRK